MRNAFLSELLDLAAEDERVVLLTGDLGFMVLEPFAERFPDRFFNLGVAEQNMVGVATGLAEAGLRPFVYSIATFASLRPYEFIRNGPALHELPVRIVGVGGGFDYGHNGVTHHALEDLAVLRTQPRLTVLAPADPDQARTALRVGHEVEGPVYFRIGKGGSPLPNLGGAFALGRTQNLVDGDDVTIVCTGAIAHESVRAAELLRVDGIAASVVLCASLSPPPVADLVAELERTSLVVTHEAHYVNGALGSLVAEVIAEHDVRARLVRCGVRDMPSGRTGSQRGLHDEYGISAERVAAQVTTALDERAGRR